MALVDFLFRCPFCGEDPMAGEANEARCPGCERRFEPGSGGIRIRVSGPEDGAAEYPARELSRRIEEFGGSLTRASLPGGGLRYRSRAHALFASRETAVRHRGFLMGFFERIEPAEPGTLTLLGDQIEFAPDGGAAPRRWGVLEVKALQSVSSSVQITDARGHVTQFRFTEDSPRRWEELLRRAIVQAWGERGLEVIEFQPRIQHR